MLKRRFVYLCITFVAVALATAIPAHATFPGRNGRLAVVYLDTSQGYSRDNIFTVSDRGTHVRRLTSGLYGSGNPRFSPDGRRIVYQHVNEIWMMNADGSNQRVVVRKIEGKRPGGWTPDFSPRGTAIVFGSYRLVANDGVLHRQNDLFIKRFGAHGVLRLTKDGFDESHPRWSPAGEQIAFVSDRHPNGSGSRFPTNDIWSVRPDGRGMERLTDTEADEMLFDFSPNGRFLLYGRKESPNWTWELWQMRADGSQQSRLATMGFGVPPHANYAPDGNKIFVAAVEGCGTNEACLLRRDGTVIRGFGAPGGSNGSSWEAR
jgi:TolB protein